MSGGSVEALAKLPLQGRWRAGHPTRTDHIVVQISRGVAPCVTMLDALANAHRARCDYWLVAGYPLVEAKNRAVDIAIGHRATLTLVEDDVIVTDTAWDMLLNPDHTVRLALTHNRDGSENTHYRADGALLYSGTCCVTIPYAVLWRLPRPVFEARQYVAVGDGLAEQGGNGGHTGSDVHFWRQLRRYCDAIEIVNVGRAAHLLHPLSDGSQCHDKPSWVRMV